MIEDQTYLLKKAVSKKEKIKSNYPKILFNIPSGIQGVVLFSGGRTSGFMLRRLIAMYPDFKKRFIVCFANTGKEMPQTLDFVNEVQIRFGIKIVWLEYHRILASEIPVGVFPTNQRNKNLSKLSDAGQKTHWFKIVDYKTASRNGKPFDEMLKWASVLPNQASRICSVQLKVRTVMRYLFSLGLKEYAPIIGIRKDEQNRVLEILSSADHFEHCQFPLVDWNITEKDVIEFWDSSDFNLKIQSYQGNCDLCFLKAFHKRIRIAKENPELVGWWKNWERIKSKTCEGDGKFFQKGRSFKIIEMLASQREIIPILENDKDIPCSCAERGFGKWDDE